MQGKASPSPYRPANNAWLVENSALASLFQAISDLWEVPVADLDLSLLNQFAEH